MCFKDDLRRVNVWFSIDFIGILYGLGEFRGGFLTECVGEPAYGAAARSNKCLSFNCPRIPAKSRTILYYCTGKNERIYDYFSEQNKTNTRSNILPSAGFVGRKNKLSDNLYKSWYYFIQLWIYRKMGFICYIIR